MELLPSRTCTISLPGSTMFCNHSSTRSCSPRTHCIRFPRLSSTTYSHLKLNASPDESWSPMEPNPDDSVAQVGGISFWGIARSAISLASMCAIQPVLHLLRPVNYQLGSYFSKVLNASYFGVKAAHSHISPVHILFGATLFMMVGVFTGYQWAINSGARISIKAPTSINSYGNKRAMAKRREALPPEKAISVSVRSVNHYHGLSPMALIQILIIVRVLLLFW